MAAVLFDLDDTLYAYPPAHRAGIAAAAEVLSAPLGLAPSELEEAYDRVRQAAFQTLGPVASAHSRHLYYKHLVEDACGRARPALSLAAAEAYWDGSLAAMVPFPGAAELLEVLRGAGVRVGVLTDLTVGIQQRKLLRLGLAERLDVLVTSEEAGHDKPESTGFLRALTQLGVTADQAVMVGDNPVNDIQGALAVGMQAIWLRPSEGSAVPRVELPGAVVRIEHFAELLQPAHLARLGVPA